MGSNSVRAGKNRMGARRGRHWRLRIRGQLILGMVASAAFVFFSRNAEAQDVPAGEGVIAGAVVSGEDDRPLEGAAITVLEAADSSLVVRFAAGETGRFEQRGLPTGRYRVEISFVGHALGVREDVVVTDDEGRVDLGVIRLAVAVVELDEVGVEAERAAVTIATDRSIYRIADMPLTRGASAVDALRAVPELEVDVEDNVRARGGTPEIHLDGRPIPIGNPEARRAFLQSLQAERVEQIEYIANPSARFEAQGESGIVNIVLARDMGLGLSGTVGATAGTRGSQSFPLRLNYQRGRLTFFGGSRMGLTQTRSSSFDIRTNLITTPHTFLEQDLRQRADRLNGGADVTVEFELTERTSIWTFLQTNRGAGDVSVFTEYLHRDADRVMTDRYDHERVEDSGYGDETATVGFRRIVQPQRDEFSVELRYWDGSNHADTDAHRYLFGPGGSVLGPPELTAVDVTWSDRVLTLQADLSKPLTENLQAGVGYRGNARTVSNRQGLQFFPDGASAGPEEEMNDRFRYEEDAHAVYLTLNTRFGNLGVQGGLRGERIVWDAVTAAPEPTFESSNNYLFPSANLAYDLGGGKLLRLSYSKRIQRPTAVFLNPIDTTPSDPVNRTTGNPGLLPTDVHSVSADGSWTGFLGTLGLSSYLMDGSNYWERIRTVDESGTSTMQWMNLRDARILGVSLNGSIRELGPFSGFAGLTAYNRRFSSMEGDRGTLRSSAWSTNLNLTARVTQTLRIQTMAMYSPGHLTAQGRRANLRRLDAGITKSILDNRGTVTLQLVDPLNLSRTGALTRDATHEQTGRSVNRIRRAALSFNYAFGRPPQSVRRPVRQESEAPIPLAP